MNKIKELRLQRGILQKELASAFHVAQNTISYWEKGIYQPDSDTLLKIADYFGVSVDYILGNTPKGAAVKIPVLGRVQAGIPIEAVQEIIDYEEITPEMAQSGDFFALQVKGDSMEPRFTEGDVVIVRQQSYADTGDIAVVLVNGKDATIKRIKKRPDGVMLCPTNPKYDAMYYNNEEIKNLPVTVIGKVVELRAKF